MSEQEKQGGAGRGRLERTPHGFSFGAAEVTADASDERGNVFVGVKTNRARISVHVTPSGLLRVWMNGMQVLTTK